jgi:hypothetical protein
MLHIEEGGTLVHTDVKETRVGLRKDIADELRQILSTKDRAQLAAETLMEKYYELHKDCNNIAARTSDIARFIREAYNK